MNKFYLETYGCQANISDSEIIKAILLKNKFKETSENKAEIIILNTCYIKLSTQNRILSRLEKLKNPKKLIIIAGCMPSIAPERIKSILPNSILINPQNIHNIIKAIKQKKSFLEKEKTDKTLLPKKTDKIYRLQIAEGCSENCYYCCAKFARGDICSFPLKNILKEFRKAIKHHKLIYITSQDNAAYGLDKNKISQLPKLLKELIKIKGNFKIRIGMMNPSNIIPILNDLIQIYKSKKIIKFAHIPLQSGSNKVLKEMNRKYTYQDFKKIVTKFREEIPNINIATDIIVGYPTETENDFNLTLSLIKQIKPEVLNISKFSPRPLTKASKLKQLPTQIIKQRSKKVTQEYKKIKKKLKL